MKPSHVLVAFAAIVVPASAQQVVFQDGFEAGLSNWIASGLLHLEDSADPCGAQVAPFPEGTKAAWYGQLAGTCSYSTGNQPNAGGLILNHWVDLPDSPAISLHFWMWSETEYCVPGTLPERFDIHLVDVEVQQPHDWIVRNLCPTNGEIHWLLLPWHERRIDLSAYRGLRVRVGIGFDTVDEQWNNGLGWFVDDVRILAEPGEHACPGASFSSQCPCLPWYVPVAGGCRNSTTQSAVMYSNGSVSVASDSLQFRVEHMPPNALALLSQSTTVGAWIPFGDGISCPGGQMRRLGTVQASNGVATWPPQGTPSISVRGLVPPGGGSRFYSVFYRDVLAYCTDATYNLTNTQRIHWLP